LSDGKTAISSGMNGTIIHWNILSGEIIKKISAHSKLAWSVAVSDDSRFIVSAGSEDFAKVWHLETGDQINASSSIDNEPRPWLKSNHPGSKVFKKCAKCHAIKASYKQRSGPHLENIFGRKVGGILDYNYSDALRSANFIWTKKTLSALFEQGPDKYLPGTKMPVQRIINVAKLEHLISYIEELTSINIEKD